MKSRSRFVITAIPFLAALAGTVPAQAQPHDEDIIVGRTGADQLAVEFAEFGELVVLPPVSGLFNGWAGDEPGFDHLTLDEPTEDFYTLGTGANIFLEIVAIDVALRGNPLTDDLDAPGEQALLGDHELHQHVDWLIDSDHAGFDPLQTQWDVSFKLIDLGTTAYAESAVYTLSVTNVPEPATAVLLAMGGIAVLRRRGR